MKYVLTLRNGQKFCRLSENFHRWVKEQGESIGPNFKTRLDQLRRYTKQDVVDWEMEDE